jgi:hypothetical protein
MFQLKPEDRLRAWREFRSTLESLPLETALARTAEFWARAPFVPFNLDPEDNSNWPDPWTLLIENSYCDVAKCLGIVYTMSLSGHKKNLEVELRVYEDTKTHYGYNLAWFNQGKYILNLIDGQVVNIKQFDKTLKLKKQFSEAQLQLENF